MNIPVPGIAKPKWKTFFIPAPSTCILKGFFILLTTFYSFSAFSQVDTLSTDSTKAAGWFDASNARVEYMMENNLDHFVKIDTSLNHFQEYNRARTQLFQHAYLGNLGSPSYPRWFDLNRKPGFDYGRHQFDIFQYQIDSAKYYRTNYPFTDLYYVLGTSSEQLFHIKHTQNIGPRANFALDFERLNSIGFYQNERNSYNNLTITGWFETKDEKYRVYAAFVYGDIHNEESGGVVSDSVFSLAQQNFATTNRQDAGTIWKDFQGKVSRVYSIGKKETYDINDSTEGSYFVPTLQFRNQFGIFNFRYTYQDPSFDRSYYDTVYIEADTLRDISDVDGFYNRLAIGNPKMNRISKDSSVAAKFNWEVYGLQQYHDVNDGAGDFKYNNVLVGVIVGNLNDTAAAFGYAADGAYDVIQSNYQFDASVMLKGFIVDPAIGITIAKYAPTVMQEHYFGFAFRWDNDFKDINDISLHAQVNIPFLNASLYASQELIQNDIYSVDGSVFFQADQLLTITQFMAEKNFNLGNFHFNNRVGLQYYNRSFIEVPQFISKISWYYERHLFNSALFMQAGIDGRYCTNYNGYSYNIVTGQFGLQSDPTIEANDQLLTFYPVIDAFLNFDIKTFRFFLKGENLSQDLFSKGYYEAPHYPMQDRSFKLGVSWDLFY